MKHEVDVIFRKIKLIKFSDEYEIPSHVEAFFPQLAASPERIVCYDMKEGFNEADIEHWYYKSKRASPEEYKDILEKVKELFQTDDNGNEQEIVVKQKINWKKFHEEGRGIY